MQLYFYRMNLSQYRKLIGCLKIVCSSSVTLRGRAAPPTPTNMTGKQALKLKEIELELAKTQLQLQILLEREKRDSNLKLESKEKRVTHANVSTIANGKKIKGKL